MSTVFQDIQDVRSLRKEIRGINLSQSITNAIETIHGCLQSGTDLNGWKKVNWRSSGATPSSGNGGSNSSRSYGSDRNDNFRNNHHSGNTNSRGNGFFRGGAAAGAGTKTTTTSNSGGHGRMWSERYVNSSNSTFGSSEVGRFNRNNSQHTTSVQQQDHQASFPLAGFTSCQTSFNTSESTYTTNNTSSENTIRTTSFSSPHSKYVSKFKKETDEVDDTIINTIILGKLNKMSVANYDEIKEFITHIINSEQTEMTKCFMRLVFQKATVEEIFCPLYAKLLSELSSSYPVLLTEMSNLYNSYMAIFEEIDEKDEKNYKELLQRNVEKKYRRGYSQFLAELIKHGVINIDSFMKTINTIIKQVEQNLSNTDAIKVNEEYTDCLIRIVNAIKSDDLDDDDDNIEEIKTIIKKDIGQRIKPLTIKNLDYKGISTKTRFSFLNIFEDIEKF